VPPGAGRTPAPPSLRHCSLCTFYTTLLPRCFADAAVIRNYRDNHTYSQKFYINRRHIEPKWNVVILTAHATIVNRTEPNRKRVWPVKITPLLHMIITIIILLFSHIHVRHIEPNWTCSWARFTLVANGTFKAFTVHWTGRVKITTFRTKPNQTEPGPVKITPLEMCLSLTSQFTLWPRPIMRCLRERLIRIRQVPTLADCLVHFVAPRCTQYRSFRRQAFRQKF